MLRLVSGMMREVVRQGGEERRVDREELASLSKLVETLSGNLSCVITKVWGESWLNGVTRPAIRESSSRRRIMLSTFLHNTQQTEEYNSSFFFLFTFY